MKKNVTLSFLMTAFLFICSSFLFTPGYGTNDDVGMSRVASGFYTGSPSEYLVYTNVILGKVLKTLYTYCPDFDWYSFYLYAIHFLSVWFLLVILLRAKSSSGFYSILLFLVLFVFFELRFLVRVQFTTTAAVSGMTGVFLVVSEALNEKKSVLMNVAGVFLIFLSFLCRSSAFYLVALTLMPFVLVSLYYKCSRLFIGSLVVTVLLCFSAGIYNHYVYQSNPAWKEFTEYNQYRSRLHGFPVLEDLNRNETDLSELGWTQNDLTMFRNWHYANQEIYSIDQLKKLIEIHSRLPVDEREKSTVNAWLQALKSHFLFIENYLRFLMIIILIFVLSRITTTQAKVITGTTLVWSLLLLLYIGFMGRLVERVSLPILYGVCLVTCYTILRSLDGTNDQFKAICCGFKNYLRPSQPSINKDQEPGSLSETSDNRPPKRSAFFLFRMGSLAILVILAGIAMQVQLNELERLSRNNALREVKYHTLLKGYGIIFQERKVDPTLISWGGYIPLGWQQPFKKYPILNDLKIINLGWATHSPNYEESLKRSNIDDLDLALLSREDVFLCCQRNFLKYYRIYLKEKYGYYVLVENIGDDIFDKFIDVEPVRDNIFRIRINPSSF